MGWSAQMAPAIMGNSDRPELGEELTNSFCRTDPEIAKEFARVTFLSDNRADLAKVKARTLILQCSEDIIAGTQVGAYVQRNIPGSKMVVLKATGHCPNLSAPEEVVAAIREFPLTCRIITPAIAILRICTKTRRAGTFRSARTAASIVPTGLWQGGWATQSGIFPGCGSAIF